MPTITLTPEQREKAISILEAIQNQRIEHPTDVVDEWEPVDTTEYDITVHDEFETHREYIDPQKIIGTTPNIVDRANPNRLGKILIWMLEGDFEQEQEYPPNLLKVDDQYMIGSDGVHRSLAAKALCIDQLYVEYNIPV